MVRVFAATAILLVIAGTLAACQPAGRVALKVGDCINYEPSENGENTIIVNCAQPHSEEVFSVYLDLSPSPTAFPGYEAIGAIAQGTCQADFEAYVGIPWDQSSYSIGFSGPTEADWSAGDHALACTLEDSNGGTLTGSAKDTAQ